jgi:ClpP class serine protease
VLAGALGDDRQAGLGRQSDETFAEGQLDDADGLAIESDGGAEGQMAEIPSRQIHGARVAVETLRNEIDDVAQRFVEVVGSRDDLSDVGQ